MRECARLFPIVLLCLGYWAAVTLPTRAKSAQAEYAQWLPLVVRSAPLSNPVHEGVATYYEADGDGSCMFGPSPWDLNVAAMNDIDYGNADYCGAYVHIEGPKGSVMVRIVDMCPGCRAGLLDLSPQAFAKIGDLPQGRIPITWQVISPQVSGPLAYHFKDGSNPWWTAVQIRNHRNPIAKFEYLDASGVWVPVMRSSYNYFIQTHPGMGAGPYSFRVTDNYGNILIDHGIVHRENESVSGSGQFPQGP